MLANTFTNVKTAKKYSSQNRETVAFIVVMGLLNVHQFNRGEIAANNANIGLTKNRGV
ncbi:MAG: hypothetical protein ACJAUR_000970 [Ulvibacter sp.]|jgi:hypothetical protein